MNGIITNIQKTPPFKHALILLSCLGTILPSQQENMPSKWGRVSLANTFLSAGTKLKSYYSDNIC